MKSYLGEEDLLAYDVVPDEVSQLACLLHATELLRFAFAAARRTVELVKHATIELFRAHAFTVRGRFDEIGIHGLAVGVRFPLTLALTLGVIEHAHERVCVFGRVFGLKVNDAYFLQAYFVRLYRLAFLVRRTTTVTSVYVYAGRKGQLTRRQIHNQRIRYAHRLRVTFARRCILHVARYYRRWSLAYSTYYRRRLIDFFFK